MDRFVNATGGRCCGTFDGEEGLGNSDDDLLIGIGHHGAIALNNLELSGGCGLYGALCSLRWHVDS